MFTFYLRAAMTVLICLRLVLLTLGNCGARWTAYSGFCYFINTQALTYHQAATFCRQQNASLADIQSADENVFLTTFVPTTLPYGVWIGYNDIKTEGKFVWDRTGSAGTFVNWVAGQPDDSGGEDCAEFVTNRVAMTKGKWNDISCTSVATSLCKKGVTCSSLAAPDNGTMSGSGDLYQSVRTFTCNIGYRLFGSSSRTCQTDGSWNGTSTSCSIVTCQTLSAPNNGTKAGTGVTYQSVVTFSCASGYKLRGSNNRTCQADGLWSGKNAFCSKHVTTCTTSPMQGAIPNVPVANFNENITFTCPPDQSFDQYDYQQNSQIVKCLVNNTLETLTSNCQVVKCNVMSRRGAEPNVTVATFNEHVEYTCPIGHSFDPDDHKQKSKTVKCLKNNTMEDLVGTCQPVTCRTPLIPLHFSTPNKLFVLYNEFVSYICGTGYSYDINDYTNRTEKVRCQENHKLEPLQGTCQRVICKSVPHAPPGSVASSAQALYGDGISYTCNYGMSFNPDNYQDNVRMITCNGYGHFDTRSLDTSPPPSCQRVKCNITDNHGASPNTYSASFGDTITYTCPIGQSFDPNNYRKRSKQSKCLANHTIKTFPQVCQGIRCDISAHRGAIPNVTVAIVNESVTYTCPQGQSFDENDYLRNSIAVRCLSNNTMETFMSVCKDILCDVRPDGGARPEAMIKTATYNETVVLSCAVGYSFDAYDHRQKHSHVTCLENHLMTPVNGTCQAVICQLTNHSVGGATPEKMLATYAEEINYTCEAGFSFEPSDYKKNSRTVKCLHNNEVGVFNGSCRAVNCIPSSFHGATPNTTVASFDDEVVYTCAHGFSFDPYNYLNKSVSLRCQRNNEMEQYSAACQRVVCLNVPHAPSGSVPSASHALFGEKIVYTCLTGTSFDTGNQTDVNRSITCEFDGKFNTTEIEAYPSASCSNFSEPLKDLPQKPVKNVSAAQEILTLVAMAAAISKNQVSVDDVNRVAVILDRVSRLLGNRSATGSLRAADRIKVVESSVKTVSNVMADGANTLLTISQRDRIFASLVEIASELPLLSDLSDFGKLGMVVTSTISLATIRFSETSDTIGVAAVFYNTTTTIAVNKNTTTESKAQQRELDVIPLRHLSQEIYNATLKGGKSYVASVSIPSTLIEVTPKNSETDGEAKPQTDAKWNNSVVVLMYKNTALFVDNSLPSKGFLLSAPILTVSAGPSIQKQLTQNITAEFSTAELQGDSDKTSCASWNISSGKWLENNCASSVVRTDTMSCSCNHLSSFALLLAKKKLKIQPKRRSLAIVTFVGSGFSITILSVAALIPLTKRKSQYATMLSIYSVNAVILLILFLAGSDKTGMTEACRAVSILLHYFLLASFCWFTTISYALFPLGKTFHNNPIGASTMLSQGLPAIIVLITMAADWSGYSDSDLCFITFGSSYGLSVICPLALLLLFNGFIFMFTSEFVREDKKATPPNPNCYKKTLLKSALKVFFLNGITWLVWLVVVSIDNMGTQWFLALLLITKGIFVLNLQRTLLSHKVGNNLEQQETTEQRRQSLPMIRSFSTLSRTFKREPCDGQPVDEPSPKGTPPLSQLSPSTVLPSSLKLDPIGNGHPPVMSGNPFCRPNLFQKVDQAHSHSDTNQLLP